jgi:hypothetical protein
LALIQISAVLQIIALRLDFIGATGLFAAGQALENVTFSNL